METAIKMHLYIEGVELTEKQAHQLLTIITERAVEAGVKMSFQIHEVEVIQ
jgi:hypothetical protein